jgi:hypothetical protein
VIQPPSGSPALAAAVIGRRQLRPAADPPEGLDVTVALAAGDAVADRLLVEVGVEESAEGEPSTAVPALDPHALASQATAHRICALLIESP